MKTFLAILIISCFLVIGIFAFIGSRIEREQKNKIQLLQHENDSLKSLPRYKVFLEK